MPMVPEVAAPGLLCWPHAILWWKELPGELCTCAGLQVPCHGKPGRHGDEPLRGRHASGGKGVNNPFRLQSVERCGGTCRMGRARQEISGANEFIEDSRRPVRPLPDPPQPTPRSASQKHVLRDSRLSSTRSSRKKNWGRVWLESCGGDCSSPARKHTDAQDVRILRALNRRQHEGGLHASPGGSATYRSSQRGQCPSTWRSAGA